MINGLKDESRAFNDLETQVRKLCIPGYKLISVDPRWIREGEIEEERLLRIGFSFPSTEDKKKQEFWFWFLMKPITD